MLINFIYLINCCVAQNAFIIKATEKGVNPTDSLNDADAIQKLIDNANSNSTIFFPSGLYLIDKPIDIMKDHLTMKGEQGTVFQFDDKTDYYALYGTRVGIVNVCSNDITMDGLYFDQGYSRSGRKDGQTPLIGGIILGCRYKNMHPKLKNITIENCTVNDYYGDGISAFNIYVTNITITNNTLISAYITGDWTTAGVKGEQAINVHSGENIVITNNTIKGALDDAIAVHNNIRNLTITGNNITTTGGRILISGVDSGYIGNNSITYIQDGGTAIEAAYSAGTKSFTFNNNIVISKNKIYINKGVKIICPIRLHGPGKNIQVIGNTLESADKQPGGIHLQDALSWVHKTSYFGDSITIKDNKFINFKNGIIKNISRKVKDPKLFIQDNEFVGAEKEMEIQNGSVPYKDNQ